MKIYLKSIKKPKGTEGVQIGTTPETNQSFEYGDVTMTHDSQTNTFILTQTVDLSDSEIDELRNIDKTYEEGTVSFKLVEYLNNRMKEVLAYLKYFYMIPKLDEQLDSGGTTQWSTNNTDWQDIPMKMRYRWEPTSPIYVLPDPLLSWFPILASKNIKPLFAFSHLHKAFNERDTRHQWINATVAAELGFKEFLAKYDKNSASLITYAPSPPLPILYKQVLKDHTGEESPFAEKLGKGASTRNDLIHKPNHRSPNKEKTNLYLHEVQAAILHLQYLLNKDIEILKYFYDRSVAELERLPKPKP
jgi:hypothetical protein